MRTRYYYIQNYNTQLRKWITTRKCSTIEEANKYRNNGRIVIK